MIFKIESVKMLTRHLKKLNISCILLSHLLEDTVKCSHQGIYVHLQSKLNFDILYNSITSRRYLYSSSCRTMHINAAKLNMSSFNEVNSLAVFILSENQNEYSEENRDELIKILNFLISHGCSINDIKKYSKHFNIFNCSYNKIRLLAEVHSDVLSLLPLLSLSTTSLHLAVKRAREEKSKTNNFPNRISYLCHHLELASSDLISALTKHPALLTMNFNRLEQKMNILKDAEISTEHIVKDLWIFNYNEKLLANRIQAAQKAGVELKPWMLRCSEKFFESMLVKVSETQRILDGEDEISYLARKLNCSKEYVDYMMERNKLLKTINIPKLEQVINFLFEKGYTPQEVRLFPRVFCSSVKTLEKKFEKFKQIRKTLPTISQLCISSKNFEESLERNKN